LANLNKRLNQIEKEKLKINDSYSDISSNIDPHHVVNEKNNAGQLNKPSNLFVKLKDFKANVNILNSNSRKSTPRNQIELSSLKSESKEGNCRSV